MRPSHERRGRATRAVALILVVLGATAGSASAGTRDKAPLIPACPHTIEGSTDVREVINGAWRSIPRLFASVNHVQGRWEPISPRNTVVVEAMSLSYSDLRPQSAERARLYRIATRLCGRLTAERSWALRLYFGATIVAGTNTYVFVTYTPSGWYVWLAGGVSP